MAIQATCKVDLFGSAIIPWRKGLAVPERFAATVVDDDLPYAVSMEVVVSRDGTPRCASVTFAQRENGEAVSPRGLRNVRLGQYLEHATSAVALEVEQSDGYITYRPRAVGQPRRIPQSRPRSPGKLTDDFLAQVAQIYRTAVEEHRRPRPAINDELGPVATATVARWIAVARERGFLNPTKERRAGG